MIYDVFMKILERWEGRGAAVVDVVQSSWEDRGVVVNKNNNKLICRAPLSHRQANSWRFIETHAYMHLKRNNSYSRAFTHTHTIRSFVQEEDRDGGMEEARG